jgi:hypothetical protein
MTTRPEELLRRYHAWERNTDKIEFQWRARLQQAMWREEQGLEAGEYRGKTRGARLVMPEAKSSLANYLTPAIRQVVREEVEDPIRSKGKLYGRPRIYDNLLSSQPLCFNLFGELTLDLDLATRALSDMTDGRIHRVTAIDFEYSPGRGEDRYTGDRSAFDVYVRYETASGGSGFVGIEVKYHEGLDDPVADHRPRYDEVAAQMGCFLPDQAHSLQQKPLQQVWRDHLLVGAHQHVDGFDDGFFAFLYPEGNTACASAVEQYSQCLSNPETFQGWTLERLAGLLASHSSAPWIAQLRHRYLDFSRLPERD